VRLDRIGDPLAITLSEGVTLSGTVRLGTDPVNAFTVLLLGPEPRRIRFDNADGRFSVPWLVPGRYSVLIEAAEGYARSNGDLSQGAPTEMRVVLSPWSSVQGQLVSPHRGTLRAVEVTLDEGAQGRRRAITDDDGRFAFERVASGKAQLTFTDSIGHEIRTEDDSSTAGTPAAVARSARVIIDLAPGQDRRLAPLQVVER
jgi:hypothetical protein